MKTFCGPQSVFPDRIAGASRHPQLSVPNLSGDVLGDDKSSWLGGLGKDGGRRLVGSSE